MWTKWASCFVFEGSLRSNTQTHSVATTVKWSTRQITVRTRAYRCALAEKSNFAELSCFFPVGPHTYTESIALPCQPVNRFPLAVCLHHVQLHLFTLAPSILSTTTSPLRSCGVCVHTESRYNSCLKCQTWFLLVVSREHTKRLRRTGA